MTWAFEVIQEAFSGDPRLLRDVQLACGISTEDAAKFCLVSPETFRGWRNGRRANPAAVRLLSILAGYMPWRGWEKWRIDFDGELCLPPDHKYGVKRSDIVNIPYLLGIREEYLRARGEEGVASDRVIVPMRKKAAAAVETPRSPESRKVQRLRVRAPPETESRRKTSSPRLTSRSTRG